MWIIWVLGAFLSFIFGCIFQIIWNLRYHGYGYIDVDPRTEQCRVRLNSNDLGNKSIKKVILKVNHDAVITREEQVL